MHFDNLDFRTLEWLFPIVVALHNAEEAIELPGWSSRSRHYTSVTPGTFRFSAAVLGLAAFAVTWLSVAKGDQSVWTYLTFGYIVAMLANVFAPHLAATIASRSYIPGVLTAVLLNLPVLTILGMSALRGGYVSGWKAMWFSVGVAGALIGSIPMLFKLGRSLGL